MTGPETPRAMRHRISTQKLGNETLVYDEKRHKAFCLNESSATVWELADGSRTLKELATLASDALKAPIDEDLVLFIVQELRTQGLAEAASSGGGEPISRRAVLQKLGSGCAILLPVIASILAPTAAQAYSGCVDCSVSGRSSPRSRRRSNNLSGPLE